MPLQQTCVQGLAPSDWLRADSACRHIITYPITAAVSATRPSLAVFGRSRLRWPCMHTCASMAESPKKTAAPARCPRVERPVACPVPGRSFTADLILQSSFARGLFCSAKAQTGPGLAGSPRLASAKTGGFHPAAGRCRTVWNDHVDMCIFMYTIYAVRRTSLPYVIQFGMSRCLSLRIGKSCRRWLGFASASCRRQLPVQCPLAQSDCSSASIAITDSRLRTRPSVPWSSCLDRRKLSTLPRLAETSA